MPSADLPTIPPDDPRYAQGGDETAAQPDEYWCGRTATHEPHTGRLWQAGLALDDMPVTHCLGVPARVGPATDDARPAADAGRAGEDVYRAAAEAFCAKVRELSVAEVAMHAPELRAAIDAARAPLLAELAEVTRQRDEADAECGRHVENTERLGREINRLTRERDEARVKAVDGGEWQWGVRWAGLDGKPIDWLQGVTETGAREFVAESDNGATLVRRRVGPVEPVSDDGSGT